MNFSDYVKKLKPFRVPLLALAGLALIVLGAWLFGGQDGRGPEPPPWEPGPLSPPLSRAESIVVIYDVSGSIPGGLRALFKEALDDANAAVVGILCEGRLTTERWRFEGTLPNFHQTEKSVTVLKVGMPRASRPYFPEVTPLQRVTRDNCETISDYLPKTGFNHPQSYLELGKAEAAELLEKAKATSMSLIMVSDFVEGPAAIGQPGWDETVNRYLTRYIEDTRFSASWAKSGRLKIRVIQLRRR